MNADLFNHLDDLLKKTLAAGADAADGVAASSMGTRAAIRGGKLSDLERSETTEIGVRALIGKKQACLATSDLDPAGFADLAERVVAMARLAPEDPYAGLADASLFARDIASLDLDGGAEIPANTLIERARAMEGAARAHPAITNVEESSATSGSADFAYVTSNGFSGGYRSSSHSLSIETIAGTGTGMVRDYDYTQARHAADLRSPEDVAHVAVMRTASRLNARKMGTGQLPVIFSSRVARGLLQNFLSAINGASVARKSSFLQNALGTQIFSSQISIVEDPFVKRGLRSKPFDGEGLATQRRRLVDKGVLTGWLLNCPSARQLGLAPTGNGSRGAASVPGISTHNVILEPGSDTPERLVSGIQEGFFVTETMGFGVNTLTGDFSQGAAGFWIEKGELAFPVHEMTIAGNLASMFKNMIPANDLVIRYGIDAPTLRIDGMTIAGA